MGKKKGKQKQETLPGVPEEPDGFGGQDDIANILSDPETQRKAKNGKPKGNDGWSNGGAWSMAATGGWGDQAQPQSWGNQTQATQGWGNTMTGNGWEPSPETWNSDDNDDESDETSDDPWGTGPSTSNAAHPPTAKHHTSPTSNPSHIPSGWQNWAAEAFRNAAFATSHGPSHDHTLVDSQMSHSNSHPVSFGKKSHNPSKKGNNNQPQHNLLKKKPKGNKQQDHGGHWEQQGNGWDAGNSGWDAGGKDWGAGAKGWDNGEKGWDGSGQGWDNEGGAGGWDGSGGNGAWGGVNPGEKDESEGMQGGWGKANDNWGTGAGWDNNGDGGVGASDWSSAGGGGWHDHSTLGQQHSVLQNILSPPDKKRASYAMPSKTLAHAINGQTNPLHTGYPDNKMNDYTNVRFVDSKRAALAPVEHALFGTNQRLARDRIYWLFSPHKDPRVSSLLAWIEAMDYQLGSYGLDRFLQSRERGALFTSADYRSQEYPTGPCFDWLTFDELQKTKDRILQESTAFYDPEFQVIVFVFLPSKSGNSMAIWRRRINVPNNTRLMFQKEIAFAKWGLRKQSQYVIHLDEAAPQPARGRHSASGPLDRRPYPGYFHGRSASAFSDSRPKKKAKWWQFWRVDW